MPVLTTKLVAEVAAEEAAAPVAPTPTMESTGETDSVAPAQPTQMGPGEEDPLVDVVVAKVALKLFALDQDIRFDNVS